jgi:hypothetical protein
VSHTGRGRWRDCERAIEGSVGDKEGGSKGRDRERGGGERDIVCVRERCTQGG